MNQKQKKKETYMLTMSDQEIVQAALPVEIKILLFSHRHFQNYW